MLMRARRPRTAAVYACAAAARRAAFRARPVRAAAGRAVPLVRRRRAREPERAWTATARRGRCTRSRTPTSTCRRGTTRSFSDAAMRGRFWHITCARMSRARVLRLREPPRCRRQVHSCGTRAPVPHRAPSCGGGGGGGGRGLVRRRQARLVPKRRDGRAAVLAAGHVHRDGGDDVHDPRGARVADDDHRALRPRADFRVCSSARARGRPS